MLGADGFSALPPPDRFKALEVHTANNKKILMHGSLMNPPRILPSCCCIYQGNTAGTRMK